MDLKRQLRMKNQQRLREFREEARRKKEEEEWERLEQERAEERAREEAERPERERRQALAEKWSDHLRELIDMEFLEEERQVRQRLTEWPLERLKKNGMVITGVQAEDGGRFYGDSLVRFSLRGGRPLPRHEFQRGDEVLVSPEGSKQPVWELLNELDMAEMEGKHKIDAYQAQVVSVQPDMILCVMQDLPPPGKTWRLDNGVNRIVYQRTVEALSEFPHAWCDEVRRVIVPDPEGTEDTQELNTFTDATALNDTTNDRLNDSQQEAVQSLEQRRITLIQGPPGCGKTYTACSVLQSMCVGEGPLLATADSHVAVDQLLGGLLERGVNAVRIGHPASINDELRSVSLPALMERHERNEECLQLREELEQAQAKVRRIQKIIYQPRKPMKKQMRNTDDQYTISLARDSVEESPFGADVVDKLQRGLGKVLQITELHDEGLIPDWNWDYGESGSGAWEGDSILAVNGIWDDTDAMREQIAKELTLEVVVKRDAQVLLDESKEEERKLRGKLRSTQGQIEMQIINEADVVCCTLAGAGGESLKWMKFNGVLIDEATQASEPRALIAVKKLSGEAARLVLVGDQCQLPPTCVSMEAAKRGLSQSLFERLLKMSEHLMPVMLTTQFRMHPIISRWPSDAFYGGRLIDSARAKARVPMPGFPWPASGPVAFLAATGPEAQSIDGVSKSNASECSVVGSVVRRLLQHMPAKDIGVISPYRGQVGMMKKSLPREVEVKTVDGFQGREKPIIIFSCVRSNDQGNVGFLADQRRLNVALTRAQRGLVVVGNPSTLENDKTWSSWLKFVRKNKLTVSLADADVEEPPRRSRKKP